MSEMHYPTGFPAKAPLKRRMSWLRGVVLCRAQMLGVVDGPTAYIVFNHQPSNRTLENVARLRVTIDAVRRRKIEPSRAQQVERRTIDRVPHSTGDSSAQNPTFHRRQIGPPDRERLAELARRAAADDAQEIARTKQRAGS